MGTDIHCHLERRTAAGQPWERVADAAVVDDRNYNLFAMMADVRNGHGFAGVRTGEGFAPIARPRGLPDDCCLDVMMAAERWAGNGHSHSWLTIAEIMSYDWSQTTTLTGIVDLPQLARWKLLGAPEMWSGSISGPGIGVIDQQRAVQYVDEALSIVEHDWWAVFHLDNARTDRADASEIARLVSHRCGVERPRFQVSWQHAYHECAGELLSRVVPLSWRHGLPENVRLVFWFDS